VFQPAGHFGFQHESLSACWIIHMRIENLFESNLAMQLGVDGNEDSAQSTLRVRPEHAEPLAIAGGRTDGIRRRAVSFALAILLG
jgi:hypothetical protein